MHSSNSANWLTQQRVSYRSLMRRVTKNCVCPEKWGTHSGSHDQIVATVQSKDYRPTRKHLLAIRPRQCGLVSTEQRLLEFSVYFLEMCLNSRDVWNQKWSFFRHSAYYDWGSKTLSSCFIWKPYAELQKETYSYI